jgi:hypothetical protein
MEPDSPHASAQSRAQLQPLDVSALLRPGVFLLHNHNRPTYIGKAKCLLVALAHHALRNRASQPWWFPVHPIAFDGISIIPCDPVRAIDLHRALVALHDPIHNRPLKSGATVDSPSTSGAPPTAVRRTSPSAPTSVRRP